MLETAASDYLIAVARAYCAATKLRLGQASAKLYGHRDFLEQFIHGEVSITLRKYDELLKRFSDNWPANAAWPRPKKTSIHRPSIK